MEFEKYIQVQVAELRPYQEGEVLSDRVSISRADKEAGSPKVGDMIARNPKNHEDQWLIAKDFFEENFENLNKPTRMDDLTFGEAIEALKEGHRVAREGWNGKGMHIFLEKDFTALINLGGRTVQRKYEPVICMWTAQQTTQPGWLASQADILAEDWSIVLS